MPLHRRRFLHLAASAAILPLASRSSFAQAAYPTRPVRVIVPFAPIRAEPNKYSFSSAGVGTGAHLTGELFRSSLNLDLLHVPYGGGGPAIQAALAGITPLSFGSPAAAIPQHQEGKLRALAVS